MSNKLVKLKSTSDKEVVLVSRIEAETENKRLEHFRRYQREYYGKHYHERPDIREKRRYGAEYRNRPDVKGHIKHVISKHPKKYCYQDKAYVERRGLTPQCKPSGK